MSGEVARIYYLTRRQADVAGRLDATASVLADRVLGLSGLISVAFLAMLLNMNVVLASPVLKPVGFMIVTLWILVVLGIGFVLTKGSNLPGTIKERLGSLPCGAILAQFMQSLSGMETLDRNFGARSFCLSQHIWG
jgi:hypothetical protein